VYRVVHARHPRYWRWLTSPFASIRPPPLPSGASSAPQFILFSRCAHLSQSLACSPRSCLPAAHPARPWLATLSPSLPARASLASHEGPPSPLPRSHSPRRHRKPILTPPPPHSHLLLSLARASLALVRHLTTVIRSGGYSPASYHPLCLQFLPLYPPSACPLLPGFDETSHVTTVIRAHIPIPPFPLSPPMAAPFLPPPTFFWR
jgi:hypothetical protein